MGNINISVKAEPSNGVGDSKYAQGFVVGPFVYIKNNMGGKKWIKDILKKF